LDNATLAGMWVRTILLMLCTFNCLIFTWKTLCYTYRRIESSEKLENMWTVWILAALITLLRRKLTNNIFPIVNVNTTNCMYTWLFYILIRISSSLWEIQSLSLGFIRHCYIYACNFIHLWRWLKYIRIKRRKIKMLSLFQFILFQYIQSHRVYK
jgi:hypothetical protein